MRDVCAGGNATTYHDTHVLCILGVSLKREDKDHDRRKLSIKRICF